MPVRLQVQAEAEIILNELRERLAHARLSTRSGAICPLCEGRNANYIRSIIDSSANFLLTLYEADRMVPNRWVHLNELYDTRGGDYAKLPFWGLTQRAPTKAGFFRITDLGRDFARGAVSVPRQVVEYKSVFLRYVDENDRVTIQECLDTPFNPASITFTPEMVMENSIEISPEDETQGPAR